MTAIGQTIDRERHLKLLCYQFAVALTQAIALSGFTLDELGRRIGRDDKHISRVVARLLLARPGRLVMLNDIADILSACGCEVDVRLTRLVEPAP